MKKEPYYITAENLAGAGKDNIPAELIPNTHLIYSSPAALSFNSPGAKGFGVKRAALSIPGSVMLLVAPGCCGRNTAALSDLSEYGGRIFYLMMDETDIVTGGHLKKIPKAVEEICECTPSMPSVVMICITCVDALLGTDMERVCRKAMDKVNIPVLPCYMYALTRESRKPPMVHVRQSIYSLLEPMEKRQDTVNILGYFAPLIENSELYDLLHSIGIRKINEISRLRDFDEYMHMAEANFNLVLNPEARFAAQDIMKRMNIPSAELIRLYQIDKVQNQYRIFVNALGTKFDDQKYYDEAKKAVDEFKAVYHDVTFAIGETLNANSFELSLALLRYGFKVAEIYSNPAYENFVYIRKIAKLSPGTKIYSNLEPTMIYYDCSEENIDITIGKDAEYYHPNCANVPWNQDIQPFGYAGIKKLFEELKHSLDCFGKEA